jgi:hypothetical protein
MKRTKKLNGNCEVCGKRIRIEMCCNGKDCGCMGLPVDPPVCSNVCYKIFNKRYNTGLIKNKGKIQICGNCQYYKNTCTEDFTDFDSPACYDFKPNKDGTILH